MEILKTTNIPHEYDAQGKQLSEPCTGLMMIVHDEHGIRSRCAKCGHGYRFKFVTTSNEEQ